MSVAATLHDRDTAFASPRDLRYPPKMERQAGLGRSLEDVLELVTPADPVAGPNGRTIFEAEDLEQQLDQLMSDIRDLRKRVQHLVGLVGDEAVADIPPRKQHKKKSKKKSSKQRTQGNNKPRA